MQDRARRAYYRARVQNLREQIPMVYVLEHFDIPVRTNEDMEIQFPCPLHGDGKDQGFSARVYPEEEGDPGGHAFCWGCDKSRDQIEWVRDYEGLSFIQAVKFLEKTFQVEDVPSIYDYFDPNKSTSDEMNAVRGKPQLVQDIEQILGNTVPSVDRNFTFLERKIQRLVESRPDIRMQSIVRIYYVYDSLKFDLKHKNITLEEALSLVDKLTQKLESL